ncbi:hypothetical protein RRG08_035416 [Elysia crispata]|uniref:Sulfotransferase domain-containing protein n=1 Tax=Elysia crispata TaxID=231223 RepID=A0AAE0Y3F5_9GAST|nr:hypothetical protein RRG08_035416 [Elysia crispata]
MRLLSKNATRWQLLRLISVWGATILCLYCITIGTNFHESLVDNRLANKIYERNLTNTEEEKKDIANPSTKVVLFKSELSTATPDTDPFDPPLADIASNDRDGQASPTSDKKYPSQPIFVSEADSRKETEKSEQSEATHLLYSKSNEGARREESEKESLIDEDDEDEENSDDEETSDEDKIDKGEAKDAYKINEERREDKNEESDDDEDNNGKDNPKKDDLDKAIETRDTRSNYGTPSSPQNIAIMKKWLTDHLRLNGTKDWFEHLFPVWKLDLHPDIIGPFKTTNWPWVTLEVGRYDPKLFTHIPGELPKQRMPKVIIFGAGKCGTRALVEFLKLHPNIASTRAEVHYFDENMEKGLAWYMTRMPLSYSNQIVLEKSPSYLWEPRAPEELYKINKHVKLILLVKDPVVRVMSQAARMDDAEHRHELLFLEEKDGKKMVKNDSRTVAAGLYVEHLKNWLKVFPLEQMHVIEGMQLIRNPYKEVKKVEEFLELPDVLTEANFYFNETRGFYCPYPFYSRMPECLSSAKGVAHPKLRPEAEKLIYDYYRPYNEELFQIIGKRFNWEPEK